MHYILCDLRQNFPGNRHTIIHFIHFLTIFITWFFCCRHIRRQRFKTGYFGQTFALLTRIQITNFLISWQRSFSREIVSAKNGWVLLSVLNFAIIFCLTYSICFFSQQDLAGSDREDAGNVTTRKILRKKYVVSCFSCGHAVVLCHGRFCKFS